VRARRWRGYASVLARDIHTYLASKRALGCRFEQEESGLRLFDRFLVRRRIRRRNQITRVALEEFLRSRPRLSPRSYNELLGNVGRLFRWLIDHGRLSAAPTLPTPRRLTGAQLPFIFDRSLAKRLLDQAAVLPDRRNAGHRGPTYRAIFALLYGLGLRVSELCQLRHRDIDLERELLLIRRAKFGKSRMVPFGPRMAAMLREHLQWNARRFGAATPEAPAFTFNGHHPINRHSINRIFRGLVRRLAFSRPPGVRFPRTHDLRHSFAVGTLLRWYRAGVDPNARLLHLATFLGHVDASSTAVYLTMTPELLHEANRRFESFGLQAVRGAR